MTGQLDHSVQPDQSGPQVEFKPQNIPGRNPGEDIWGLNTTSVQSMQLIPTCRFWCQTGWNISWYFYLSAMSKLVYHQEKNAHWLLRSAYHKFFPLESSPASRLASGRCTPNHCRTVDGLVPLKDHTGHLYIYTECLTFLSRLVHSNRSGRDCETRRRCTNSLQYRVPCI